MEKTSKASKHLMDVGLKSYLCRKVIKSISFLGCSARRRWGILLVLVTASRFSCGDFCLSVDQDDIWLSLRLYKSCLFIVARYLSYFYYYHWLLLLVGWFSPTIFITSKIGASTHKVLVPDLVFAREIWLKHFLKSTFWSGLVIFWLLTFFV